MKKYRIARTELEVSRLAWGTWRLGGEWNHQPLSTTHKERATSLLRAVHERGINHVDLADIYMLGKSDEAVGHALRETPGLRQQLILQEKAGIVVADRPEFGPPGRYDFSATHLIRAVEGSLTRLGTDYLDLLAFHRPDALFDPDEVALAVRHLKEKGKVRYFGVSNHSVLQIQLLQKSVTEPLVVNQLELSLVHPHLITEGILVNQTAATFANTQGLLDYCRLHDVTIQAWSPLGSGRLFSTGPTTDPIAQRLNTQLEALAERKATSKEAIALAWLLRHPAGIQPIVGTTQISRLDAALPADAIELERAEWYSLLEAARGAQVP